MDKRAFLQRLEGGRAGSPEPVTGWPEAFPADPAAALLERMAAAGAGVHRVAGPEEALQTALAIMAEAGGPAGVADLGPELNRLLKESPARRELDLTACGDGAVEPREVVAPLQAGLTRAELALAAEGAIVQVARTGGGRWLSLLPPVHVALLHADDVLASIAELPAALRDPARFPQGPPPAVSIIGGPSKTGDIEAVIVLGVHGPGRLEVVLWG